MTAERNVSDAETVVAVPDAFHVRDASIANWVVRKVVEARQYAERVQAWADGELRRAKREEEFFLFRFGGQLEQWARQEIDRDHRHRKSICLPAGAIGFRLCPTRLNVTDEQQLRTWCKANLPAAIVTRELLCKRTIADYITKTGDVQPGGSIKAGR